MYSSVQSGQNSQMFIDASSCQIKHLLIYVSLFIDEFSLSRITYESRSNFISGQAGFGLFDHPFQNFMLIAEYTQTNPITFQHNINTTIFESNNYNLGHYLRDNFQEIFFS